ncbi:NADH-quinone oxidoreductase subunit N [Halomonas sp. TRM85114]|uniref:proton-conducting transporter transmembrane domain-containing protein n=1 Tax=Halomonas jincaotanensis TaxID=2810616 RepID=UPI001BD5E391|nr:proton-conducting transporter membrane subunit [Halomonas jincaotanensis]MBS9404097.1 NADH-quinone oxidoreductase subunit N [Halomonas jincaotanensis]
MTTADWLLPLLVVLPLALAIAAFLGQLTARQQVIITLIGLGLCGLGLLSVTTEITLWLGGWAPPVGIAWQLDTPAKLMLGMVGLLMGLASLALLAEPDSQNDRYLWSLCWLLWAALNALLLSRDLFNLYVTLELMSLAAVGLVSRSQEDPYHVAAIRYLMASLLGSLLYLLGVALLYGQFGRLDLGQLAAVLEDGPAARLAALAITLGLLIKAAMVPLHGWLPAAHSRAPAPISALLSGAVVAAALMVLWRLWLEPFADLGTLMRQALAALGALAMVWGGIQALLQNRLKLVIAWSTLSQSGYALLLPALAGPAAWQSIGGQGALLLLVAHGLAKGGLFLAAGRLHHRFGHDRLAGLSGSADQKPLLWAVIALGGLSLMGLPPSGGFMGKWWLLRAALDAGQPLLAVVMLLGTLLTATWLWRLVSIALAPSTQPITSALPPASDNWREATPALLLVALAWLAGLIALGGAPGLSLVLPRFDADRLAWLLPALLIWPLALAAAESGKQSGAVTGSPRGLSKLLGLTAAAHLIILLAGDLFTFYLGAAWLGLAGWSLVRLDGPAAARRAAAGYLAMMMIAEVSLLLGLTLTWQASDSLAFKDLAATQVPASALVALGLGLAIKAGAIGVHAWLPLAHPVAPPVASAVLSGLMIKVGVLGGVLLVPGTAPESRLGLALVVAGLGGALYAALRGLAQVAPKPLLAWSSVSQMGLATSLLGLYQLGSPAALPALLGLVAAHALAKAVLFLGAGLAGRSTTRRWLLLGALVLPALTLAGLPPSAGMAVKTGMEEALAEATLAAWPVTLSGVLTGLLMLRLFWLMHRASAPVWGGVPPGWLLAALWGLGLLAALLPWAFVDAPRNLLASPGGWLKAMLPALLALVVATALMVATPLHRRLATLGWRRRVQARARRLAARRAALRWRWRLRRGDAWLMPWPAFGVCLGLTALLLGLAGLV